MIPGANIMRMASRLIAQQSFEYYAFLGRTLQPNGQDVANYAPSITVTGSVQPVARNLIQQYGLDFQANYQNFYMPRSVLDVTRDVSGDQFKFNGSAYQALSKTDWASVDGWVAVLCVQVPLIENGPV